MRDDLTKLITGVAADGSLYPVPKLQVHQSGDLHLAISVFLYSDAGVLLQKRAQGKYHSGGLWANSCCSHPDWQEDIAACARRRCMDELNLDVDLAYHGVLDYHADVGAGLIEHERAHIYSGKLPVEAINITPNPDEVSDTRWANRADLERQLDACPEQFTAWFQQYMSRDDAALKDVREHIWTLVAQ